MPSVFNRSEYSALEAEPPAEQENFKSRPMARKGPMNSLSKKPIKGGGKSKGSSRRGGEKEKKKKKKKKKKKVKKVKKEKESSDESLIVSDLKGGTIVEDSDTDSGDDGGISEGGESNVSEYKETSVVVKRAVREGIASREGSSRRSSARKTSTSSPRKTPTSSGGVARIVYTRKSASPKSPKERESKRAPGRKGKAKMGKAAGENSDLLDEVEVGYYPDGENDENDENYLETSNTPAKRSAVKVIGRSVGRGTSSRTVRKTTSDRGAPAKTTAKAATKSPHGEKAPIGFESNSEQEGGGSNFPKAPQMVAAKKRKASGQEDSRLKKVAKRTSAKNVGTIKASLETLSLDRADKNANDDADDADGSMQYFGAGNTGYIISGGTSEQRAAIISASSNNPAHSVLQSEKVIGSGRLMHGGKSVAKLQALWEMGLPKDYRE